MRFFAILIFLFGCLVPHSMRAQEKSDEGFVLVKEDGLVSIFERWIIFPQSNPPIRAREVKGEFFINTSLHEILRLMKDETKIRIWQKHVSKFKVYPQHDTTVWREYSYHDIPWPVSDQDHFLEYKITESKPLEELFITFQSVSDLEKAPLQQGVTRMILSGSWRLKQTTKEQVKITYRILSMPIGIPRLFTDPVIRSNLMSTIKSLTRLAEQ